MEFDDDESDKTFTTLTNFYDEPMNDSKLHFEKFLFAGDSDSEVEHEENFTYSDDSNDVEEEVEDIEDPLIGFSDASQQFSQGSEDWRNSDSQCLNLTELMRMNRNEKFQLLQLFHKIKDFLIDIQNKMKILKSSSQKIIKSKESIMFLGHVGAPYFKTKKEMFCSDPNPDTLDRRKRGLLSIYQHGFPSRWSKTECDNLTRGVKLTYNLNKQRALLKEIGYLKRKIAEETDSAIILQKEYAIEKLEGEIRNLKAIGIADVPPLCEDKFIDWDHISTEYLMDKHTAKECSIFWRIYLHPDLNKSNWSTKENKAIRELAEKYNYQDWDRIAQELGTNRSAFTIFIHYSSTLCHQPTKIRFSEEEDRALLEHIENKKTGALIPWNTIAEFFPNRSKIQLIHRYKYYLRNMSQYTTEFSDAEDILILLLVERFGRNYVQFPKYLPSKSYMQIKARYDNHLRFNRVKGSFTLEEDRQIMNHFSNKKFEITHLSAHMKRNRLQLRQRYKKLTEFFNKHPDKSLEDVPRRFGKKNETFRKLEFLKYVVDQFKDQIDIPSLSDIEKKLGKKKSKKNQNFDNLLVSFFSSSYAIKQKSFETSLSKIKKTAEQIHNIIKILGINLRIPAEIKKNNTLDIVDIEILNILREKDYTHMARPAINEFLPPNMNSLIGLRGLLLKNQSYKRMKNKETVIYRGPALMNLQKHNLASELDVFLKNKHSNTQSMVLFERDIFLKRFISMFMWPAILSIESPSSCLLEKEFGLNNSNQSKDTNKKNNTGKNKLLKRKLDGNSDIPLPKKTARISLGSDKSKCNHESTEPVRSSSRLKDKKRISEKISLQEVDLTEEDNPSGQQSNSCKEVTESNKNKPVVLSNLVRVDKNEIMKLLQNKKPIKIIKIKCIKEPDGSLPTPSQPSHSKTDNETTNIQKLKNVGPSSLITSADNNRNNNDTNSPTISQNSNSLGNRLLNLYDKKNTSNNSSTKYIMGEPSSKISNNDDAEDIHKLDDFLNNVEDEESIIDLTETEVMKNEIEQLDQLIKQEKSLSSF